MGSSRVAPTLDKFINLSDPQLCVVFFLKLGAWAKPRISLAEGLPLHPIKKGMKIHKNQLACLGTRYVV